MQTHFDSNISVLQKKFVNEQTLNNMYRSENSVSRNNVVETSVAGNEYSLEKMAEYLIPEVEPQIKLSELISISFREFEPALTQENNLNNDLFLNDLKMQASKKTNEAVAYYALEKKLREYLIAEPESKLTIEDWMLKE
jgi:hypothetical protein